MMDWILAIIGLLLSVLFAGSETAYISINKFRYKVWVRQKRKSAIAAKKYFDHPELFFSTTLVGNNVANIMASSYATIVLIVYLKATVVWAIVTFVLLTFGEIIPKIFFRTYANSLLMKVLYPIRLFHFIFYPFIFFINWISGLLLRVIKTDRAAADDIFSKEDVEVLLKEGRVSGAVDSDEHKIIKNVLDLPETPVREAMVPRTQIYALPETATINQARKIITKSGFSKIPVYRESIDSIIGIIFLFDLFTQKKYVREIIKPVILVPENKKCNELLREFQASKSTVAIVLDEYGGTAGMVTVEDVVSELFGELEDQNDIFTVRRLNKNTWEVNAATDIEAINDRLDIGLPEGSYETIGGYVLNRLGHIPESGEKLFYNGFKMVVSVAEHHRIKRIRIIRT